MRIAIVAPSTAITPDVADQVTALAAAAHPEVELSFHPQCFLNHGHFAGTDAERADALVEAANNPAFDALWFARGGYGSCRIAEEAIARLTPAARDKTYLGYSDAGYLLAGLYRAGHRVAHGPMPRDIIREGGDATVLRALAWLAGGDAGSLEANVGTAPAAAFNVTVLSLLLGTPLEPDLGGHVVMLEEVSEYMYRIDRSFYHLTANAALRRAAGIRLGRCSDIPDNDPDFGQSAEEVVRHWCARAGIAFLGSADIGHDSANKVVPFGSIHR